MIGLIFIALALGLWLLAISMSEHGYFLNIDVSHIDLVLGQGAARWLCGAGAAALMLISLLGVIM